MITMKLSQLHKEILGCRLCESIGIDPSPIVWGMPNAKIMQISQAPSLNVKITGKPFNDISGRRLREWYGIDDDTFYNKQVFYITSIAHCYPGKNKNGGDNKPPTLCADTWLRKEMDSVKNQFYVIIGSYAASYFFKGKKMRELVFENQTINNKPAIVMPHPSLLALKWLKDNPEFLRIRLPEIREMLNPYFHD